MRASNSSYDIYLEIGKKKVIAVAVDWPGWCRVRGEVLRGLELAAEGQLPQRGPRGGKRWPARFFARRLAWHAVDHAWGIEDRIII